MTLLNGKETAAQIRAEIKGRADRFLVKRGYPVGLAVVLIGENPASQVYVRNKIKACEEAGIRSFAYYLPQSTSQKDAEELVSSLAENKQVHGILVQLPLPNGLDAEKILAKIPAEKDIDGFSENNIGSLALGKKAIVACTPLGVMELLKRYGVSVAGKRAVVVTVCHSKTQNLKEECRNADILIAAIGKAKFITADMVKENAIVVDVGMNRDENGLCGDVDFAEVQKKASYITPVPGGVGPMTIAMLMYNVCEAAERTEE